MALANVHRFTTDEFLAIDGLPRRVELLDGVIYDLSPEGPAHARAQRDALNALTAALPDRDVLAGGSMHVTETFCPCPDCPDCPDCCGPDRQPVIPAAVIWAAVGSSHHRPLRRWSCRSR
jgi:Uma2 family endonuclease